MVNQTVKEFREKKKCTKKIHFEKKMCLNFDKNEFYTQKKKLKSLENIKEIQPKFRKYYNNKFIKTDKCICTIIFLNDKYIQNAICFAKSFRFVKTKINLVCLIQDKKYNKFEGVSNYLIKELLKVFDVIYGCDLLKVSYSKWVDNWDKYKYIDYYVTKGQVLGLIEYKQLLFLDSSYIAIKNLDNIFTIYKGNHFQKPRKNKSKGIGAIIYIIRPTIQMYSKYIHFVKNYDKIFKNFYSGKGPDEILLYFSIKWNYPPIYRSIRYGIMINNLNTDTITHFTKFTKFTKLLSFLPIKQFNLLIDNLHINNEQKTHLKIKLWNKYLDIFFLNLNNTKYDVKKIISLYKKISEKLTLEINKIK